jgi:hypothetical protein
MPKEKSLLNKTSAKSKKRNKYSETSKSVKEAYKFDLHSQVIYLGGLYPDKHNKICTIVGRSQNRARKHYYKVKFEDELIIETIVDTLGEVKLKEKEDDEIID